jgi:methylenetetrahydrofolate reductase (NADPH)
MQAFRETIRTQDLVVTAELPLTPVSGAEEIRASIATLRPYVDAVHISDNRMAAGHASPVPIAALAISEGLDAIPHLSCRDRNRIALQGDILGAAATGVTSLLIARGENVPGNAGLRGKGVFDGEARDVSRLAQRLGEDPGLVTPPGFLIGSYATVFVPAADWQASRLDEKIEAGARFLLTQPCLSPNVLEQYMVAVVEQRITHRASVIIEVPLVTDVEQARSIKDIYPGAPLPDETIQRIASAPDPAAEGIQVAAEMLRRASEVPGVSGLNVVHYGKAATIAAAICESGLR